MNRTPPPDDLPLSLGAAGVAPLWLLFHGRIKSGLFLLVVEPGLFLAEPALREGPLDRLAIPLHRGGLAVIAVTFLLYGSRIAWVHKGCRSVDELERKERGWTIIGTLAFAAYALWIILT